MWLWVTIGWSLVALVAAALHHRFRRATGSHPPEVAAFVLRLETELAEAHPDVQFLGMLPDRLACLLRVRGQETPVSLHHAFRHAEAFPDAFSRMVANLVGDLGEAALDRVDDIDFAAAAPLILPQVRSRAWLEAQGCFGDSALAHRPMNDELVTVYVVDDVNCMLFICREHMRRWRKSEEDLHNLALANLARLGSHDLRHLGQSEQPTLLHSGDGFDAARVLLLEPAEGLLVAIPDRDTLWVGAEHGHSLEQLMATTEAIAQQAAHPVSPTLWRFTDGRLQAWKP
ncbi:MAG TPA: hypothetical protein VFZ65_07285 [Planctomycetota bacterium]|nr:hypothetical protein [Planctomycetota bacterium]